MKPKFSIQKEMKRKDDNEQIADLVSAVTGTKKPRGEDLLGNSDLKRQLIEAKKREAARKANRKR